MVSDKYLDIVSQDPMVVRGRIVMSYTYFAGQMASRFYVALRDQKRILGNRCERCGITYVPPRSLCSRCFSRIEEWKEVGPGGVLETWTITHYLLKAHPAKEPIIYGMVKLDGASTGLVHILGEVEERSLKLGLRVRPVFKDERHGNILDIRYFKPE